VERALRPVRRPSDGWLYDASVTGAFLILLLAALSYAHAVFVPVTAAVLTGLLFGPVQTRLERRGVPPFLGAALILLGFVAAILVGVRLLVIPFRTWVDRLPEMWAALRLQLYTVRGLVLAIQDATQAVQQSAGIAPGEGGVVLDSPDLLSNLAVVPSVLAQVVLFLGVLFFFLASRTRLRAQLLSLCLNRANRLRTARIIQESERAVSGYVGTIIVINFGLGVVTAVALYVIGVPNAGFWGAMAGLLNFLPYIGPALFFALLFGVGLVEGYGGFALYLPLLAALAIHVAEANFVTPTVLGTRMTVEPLLVVISLAAWLWLWGPVGAFLAVPLLLVIKVVVRRILF
jgi:predicted PurR-regulated permease PerM